MATSKSRKQWIAGAYIYSGRRDPTWPASKFLVRKLQLLWETLPPSPEKPRPPGLGYRGAFLRAPDHREWLAFNGIVTLTDSSGPGSRKDHNREFERSILSSAPTGVLPPDLKASE
jgi:hypothetical protein